MSEFINNWGLVQKNVTLQNLIKLHEYLVDDSNYVQQGGFGDISEIDIDQTQLFPLAFLSIENTAFTKRELTYNFRLYVMDLVSKDESNENDVLSDTLQYVGDYVSLYRHGFTATGISYDMEYDFRMNDNVSCEPFTERFDSQVSGWAVNFSITVSWTAGACSGETM